MPGKERCLANAAVHVVILLFLSVFDTKTISLSVGGYPCVTHRKKEDEVRMN